LVNPFILAQLKSGAPENRIQITKSNMAIFLIHCAKRIGTPGWPILNLAIVSSLNRQIRQTEITMY
jgi:hypothetical protein